MNKHITKIGFLILCYAVRIVYWVRLDRFIIFLMYNILYKILRYRYAVIHKNVVQIKSQDLNLDIKKTISDYYRHLSHLIIETLWSYTASQSELFSRVRLKQKLDDYKLFENTNHITVLISHIGNWEMLCQYAPLLDKKIQINILYTAIKTKSLDTTLSQIRERTGAKLVSTKSTLELYRRQQHDGQIVNLFAADQNPGDPYHQQWMDFFGVKVPVITGAEKFAISQKQSCYYIWVEKINGVYILDLIPITYDSTKPYDLTEQYLRLLEQNILVNPALWLLSHNRFKYAKA